MAEHEIILTIDASRVEMREGEPYLHLTREDFDQVPREALVHWYEMADTDPALTIPFTVKLEGDHRAKVSGCIHDWEQLEPDKWECRKGCGGKRAWRTYPEGKGDASLGVVTKHYAVKR